MMILKKVIIISSVLLEAFLFTSLTVTYILFIKMFHTYVDRTGDFTLQIQLYLTSVLMLMLSKLNLPKYDYELYTILSLIHMGALPYYTSIKGEISTDDYI